MSPTSDAMDVTDEMSNLDIHQVVQRLNTHLGATAVAILAGSRNSKAPYKWAKPKPTGTEPSAEAAERLRTAHRVWKTIADAESDDVARTWFMGNNPILGETSPILALREGRYKDIRDAATAFVTGTWSG